MSSTYNPNPIALGAIKLPQDGVDFVKAAAVNPALQALADGVKYNTSRINRIYNGTKTDSNTRIGYTSSTSYADLNGILEVPNITPMSMYRIWYNFHIYSPSSSDVRLAVGPNRDMVEGGKVLCGGTSQMSQYSLIGYGTASPSVLSSGSLNIYLQAKATSGVVELWHPFSMIVEIEEP